MLTIIMFNSNIPLLFDFSEDSVTIKWLVRLGSTFASTDGTTFTINNIITHPDYSQLTKTNDIAILQVVGFITYTTTIQPARIGGVLYELPEGEILKAVGWGRTSVSILLFIFKSAIATQIWLIRIIFII